MKQKKFFLILLILLPVFIFAKATTSPNVNTKYEQYAQAVLKKCATQEYKPSCYDEEVPKLMDPPANLSLEDSFQVTKLIQDQDKSFQYCHVLGHNLSAKEVKKDPGKWKEIVSRCPSGLCSNGCLHGGFQERFRSDNLSDAQIESIKPDLKNICEKRVNWQPTKLEQASCYHALGHLTMYLTGADLNKSINLCKEIALKQDERDFRRLCFDGVFMQIFQPLEPEDFALVKGKQPTKEEVVDFCSRFNGWEKASCLSESWPLFRADFEQPQGIVDFCSLEEKAEQDRCYSGVAYVMTAQVNFNLDKMFKLCAGLPKDRVGSCFGDVATRLIETDYRNITEAVDFCSQSLLIDKQGHCFDKLVRLSTYSFKSGSEEFLTLCNSLPDRWRTKC